MAAGALLALTLGNTHAFAAPPDGKQATQPANRPTPSIVGRWTLDVPGTECIETYHFDAGGSSGLSSAQEVSQNTYTLSSRPDAKGFYKLVDTIVRDNGKPDCTGSVTPPGDVATRYVFFDRDEDNVDTLLLCMDQTFAKCVGPLRRVRGGGAR